MDKIQLLETAEQLKKVSDKSSAEYQQKADQIINQMNVLMSQRSDL